jgi:hypothetical protein
MRQACSLSSTLRLRIRSARPRVGHALSERKEPTCRPGFGSSSSSSWCWPSLATLDGDASLGSGTSGSAQPRAAGTRPLEDRRVPRNEAKDATRSQGRTAFFRSLSRCCCLPLAAAGGSDGSDKRRTIPGGAETASNAYQAGFETCSGGTVEEIAELLRRAGGDSRRRRRGDRRAALRWLSARIAAKSLGEGILGRG